MLSLGLSVPALSGAALAQTPALKGLDPVALCRGEELPGQPELTAKSGRYTYQFATETNLAAFRADPTAHEIQLGGGCGRMGPLSGAGDPDRWLVHAGRIYIFASPQCRDAFGKKPELFLEPDDKKPQPSAEDAARGALLLQRAIEAHGGADRLRAWQRYGHMRSAAKDDVAQQWRLRVEFPDNFREDHEYRQGDRTWHYANVLAKEGAFSLVDDQADPMHTTARREAVRRWLREPAFALRRALTGDHVAAAAEPKAGGEQVQELQLWIDGCATTFGIGPDGLVRTARFRGRGPQLWYGEVVLAFADFDDHSGLRLPRTVQGTFEGVPASTLAEARERVDVAIAAPTDAPETR